MMLATTRGRIAHGIMRAYTKPFATSGFETRSMNTSQPRRSWLVFSLSALLVLLAMLSVRTLPAAESTEGRQLTVTVLDAAQGKPIVGAEVSVPALSWGAIPRPTNEWKLLTDQRGQIVVRVPTNDFQQFVFYVRHTNYAQRGASWYAPNGSVMGSVPDSFTFRLDPGVTVGGFVRDERGDPIPNATIVLTGSRNISYAGVKTHDEFPMHGGGFGVIEPVRVPVDARGFWQEHHLASDLDTLQIDVERPGGAKTAFATVSADGQAFGPRRERVAMEALRATNAVFTLKDGMTVHGIVVDSAGKPVPNARIKERSGRTAQNSTYIFTNGADGRFELKYRRAPQLVYTVEAQGFAISTASILTANTNQVRIVMAPLSPLRLRVLSEQGEPVANAYTEIIPWKSQNESLEWKAQTDAEGRVVWTNAPAQEVSLYVRGTNFPIRIIRVQPGADEQIVKLRKGADKSVYIGFRVVDAASGAPLEKFEVWRDLQGYRPFVKEGDGAQGTFTNEFARTMFERGNATTFRFQVRAEGYGIWTTEQLQFEEGDQGFTVKLEKGGVPAGIVFQPDGKPAAGATVYRNARNQGSLFANRQGPEFYAGQAESVNTGSDGAFKFSAAEDDSALVFVHPSGFASMTVGEMKRSPKVSLQPYATLSGTVTFNGEPRKGERLHLKAPINWSGPRNYLLVFNAVADEEGKFTFTNLPPGDYVLSRTPHTINGETTTESHRWPMDLKPGEHKSIDYTFNGRSVVGHVEATAKVDWRNDSHVLAVKVPPGPEPPNYYDFADVKAFEAARDAFGKLPAVVEHERKQQSFQLLFDPEGNFRVDDVPPGTYELRLRATKPPVDRNSPRMGGRGPEIGSLVREIVIPPGKEDFDVGTLEMQAKGEAVSRVPLEFRAVRVADDKPFDIASLRGKPVVVTFWGNWAPHSLEFLSFLRGLQDEMKDQVAIVTVNLDDDKDIVNAHLSGLPQTWTHTTIRGRDRYQITERLDVNSLPVTLVLDSTGRVVTRDVQEKRLGSTLKRMMAKTGK